MQMTRATYEGIKKFLYPNRPFLITRSCYSGAQRYSSVWTGDNIATWEHLWIANMQIQRLNMSGISFAGSDVGGFIGNPDGELYARWIQMACFHPFCRTHSAGNDPGAEPQEPWSYGSKVEFIAKKYIQLRYQLLPYIYTTFWQHSQYGTPMIRPMVMVDQEDIESLHHSDQYMFGDKILVCPVSLPDADTRLVYLPKGRWYNFWDDTLEHGGKEIEVDAPLDKMPLFVREGAVIPHYPKMQYVGEIPVTELTLHVYYTKTVQTSHLYEDAGDYYGYRNGQFNIKKFVITNKKGVIKIFQTISGNFEATYKHYKIVLHGIPSEITEYEVDGRMYKITRTNNLLGVIKFKTSAHFKEVTIRV
jgi:alpha-glucosidase